MTRKETRSDSEEVLGSTSRHDTPLHTRAYRFVVRTRMRSLLCRGAGGGSRFDKGLVTMFKVAAGMGWPESLPAADSEGTLDYGAVCFFASFILVLNWTLLQVRETE